jgi:hypothetical protein
MNLKTVKVFRKTVTIFYFFDIEMMLEWINFSHFLPGLWILMS